MFEHAIMTKADFLLTAAILVFAGVLLVRHFTAGPGDGWVVVSRDGVVEERLPLSEDTRLLLKDASGNENLLVIEHMLTVRTGSVSGRGQSAAAGKASSACLISWS